MTQTKQQAYRTYRVTVIPIGYVAGRSSAHDEIDQDFTAKTAADAIRQAKSYMVDVCGWTKSDGQIKYKARRAES